MGNEFNAKVGAVVRFLREEQGLSTYDLSARCHLSSSWITKLEKDRLQRKVDASYIENIAKALAVPVDALTEDNASFIQRVDRLEANFRLSIVTQETVSEAESLLAVAALRGPRERTRVYQLRGIADYLRGMNETALTYLETAFEIALKINDQVMTKQIRQQIASSLLALAYYKRVEELIQDGLVEVADDQEYRMQYLFILGSAYFQQEKWEDAEVAIRDALLLSKEIQNEKFTAQCLQVLGAICLYKNRIDEAIRFSEASIKLANRLHHRLTETYALLIVGKSLLAIGNTDDAKTMFEKALTTLPLGRAVESLDLQFLLAKCEKNTELAYEKMRRVIDEVDRVDAHLINYTELIECAADLAVQLGRDSDVIILLKKVIQKFRGKA